MEFPINCTYCAYNFRFLNIANNFLLLFFLVFQFVSDHLAEWKFYSQHQHHHHHHHQSDLGKKKTLLMVMMVVVVMGTKGVLIAMRKKEKFEEATIEISQQTNN